MPDVFRRLLADFFSSIVFVAVYFATDNILLATGVGIAGAVGQFVLAKVRGQPLDLMTWASLALVVVLGTASIVTNDPRFILVKPSIAHFAIGAIMLRRNWMERYVPEIVRETAPDLILIAGYCWAALMFALGTGTVIMALIGDKQLYFIYVSVVLLSAKLVAFGIQYVVFRVLIRRRIRAHIAAGGAPPAALAAR